MSNKFWAFGLILFLTIGTHFSVAQTNRGAGNVKVKTGSGQMKEIKLYDGSYALVIGESNYTNGWDALPGVKTDVVEVRSALERQGFKVESELNLTAEQFKTRVDRFVGDYGYGANNQLLIYFAGHGHTQKSADGRDLGYIIPVDAPDPKDDLGFRRKAISMDAIQAYARQIEAKHALFIFDSCFSGKLISRDKIAIPPIIEENVAFPVRQFITAGAANQSVPDDSIFRKAFVRGLDGEADRNNDGYITGSELADYLKEKVTNNTDRTQTPQYGKIRDIDLDKGDFVFISINNSSTNTPNNNSGGNISSYPASAFQKYNWSQVDGSWNLNNGLLRQTNESSQPALIIANNFNSSSYTLKFKARSTSPENGIGVVFHFRDNNNSIWWDIGNGYGNKSVFEYKTQGNVFYFEKDSSIFKLETNRWYDVRLEVNKDNIKGYVDGILKTQTILPDDASKSGSFGFRCWTTTAEYKDLEVIQN